MISVVAKALGRYGLDDWGKLLTYVAAEQLTVCWTSPLEALCRELVAGAGASAIEGDGGGDAVARDVWTVAASNAIIECVRRELGDNGEDYGEDEEEKEGGDKEEEREVNAEAITDQDEGGSVDAVVDVDSDRDEAVDVHAKDEAVDVDANADTDAEEEDDEEYEDEDDDDAGTSNLAALDDEHLLARVSIPSM
jgi:hypothetical protein